MRRRTLYILLACEAAGCIALFLGRAMLPGFGSPALAFPFWQIAAGLRALSLTGRLGNALALTLLVAASLVPLLPARKGPRGWEDALLPLLTLGMMVSLILMANPARLRLGPEGELSSFVAAAMGLTLWSVFVAWAALRVLRYFKESEREGLFRAARVMLSLLCAGLVAAIFAYHPAALADSIAAVLAGNTGRAEELGTTYTILALRHIVAVLALGLDIWLAMLGLELTEALEKDPYSEEVTEAAEKLTAFCGKALAVTVLSSAAMNGLQLIFMSSLADVRVSADIPVFSVAFALCALLLTRLLTDRKRLKDDNDLFV